MHSDQTQFGFHVVALMDFLGQSRELACWNYLPENRDDPRFLDALRRTYGRMLQWRGIFKGNFDAWQVPARIPAWVVNPDPELVAIWEEYKETSLEMTQFSDTIVVYSPLTNRHGYLKVDNVCSIMISCGQLMLPALASSAAFRGAIEIGMAGQFPEADLYGPALAKAHHLENKVANYPRIVVGPGLLRYLSDQSQNPGNDPVSRANRGMAILEPSRYVEGACRRVSVNAYERDENARRRCIEYHGTNCCVCGLSFGLIYGEEAEGYIHVHHVRPLAEIGREYSVDPVKDLRPVCPNCHAVLHLGERCRTIEEVQRLVQRQKGT